MQTVINYRLAYLPQAVDLCEDHSSVGYYGVLGPVQHGAHRGECIECGAREMIAALAAEVGDDGTDNLGVIVREALASDPGTTLHELVEIVGDARDEARA